LIIRILAGNVRVHVINGVRIGIPGKHEEAGTETAAEVHVERVVVR